MWLLRRPHNRKFPSWQGYLAGIGSVSFITWLLVLAQPEIIPRPTAYPYMLSILPTAIYFGLGPALFTSLLGVLAYDYFLLTTEFATSFLAAENLSLLLIFLLVSLVVSLLASNLRYHFQEAKRLNQELIKAQENERKRIARELHDDAAPNLAYLSLELDAMVTKSPDLSEKSKNHLRELGETLNHIQQDIRQYSHELHPAILDQMGLEPALDTLVTETNTRGGIKFQFKSDGAEISTSDEVNLALYRITQEALNNAWKHSKATLVVVNLGYSSNRIRLSIVDNGAGFDPSALNQGLGLTGMKERANLIGAKLKIISQPGKGTDVSVEMPL
jgi:signal transduction histidine kinase